MYWLLLLIAIMIILFGLAYSVGQYFFYRAIDIRSDKSGIIVNSKHAKKREEDIWFYEESGYQDIIIQNKTGLRLHGYQITHASGDRWVIFVHGYMGSSEDLIAEAKHFYDLGYQILCIDLQGHGKSEGKVIGFGCLDREDLKQWVSYINATQHVLQIILYGVSMGAATVMMCSDQQLTNVVAIIEDCGFTTLQAQLEKVVNQTVKFISPKLLINCLKLVMKHKAGYRISDCQPIEHVRHAKIPMLFLHGDRDAFIPCTMMEELSKAYPGNVDKHLIRGGRHANSSKVASSVYWEYVDAFLKEHQL